MGNFAFKASIFKRISSNSVCPVVVKTLPDANNSPPKLQLSSKERQLIVETWQKILQNGDPIRLGIAVFNALLTQPAVRALFPFGNLCQKAMQNNSSFKGHAARFAEVVSAVIDEIAAKMDEKSDGDKVWNVGMLLRSLGSSHTRNQGLKLALFEEMAEKAVPFVMVDIWKKEIGDDENIWNDEIANAWLSLFRQITRQVYIGFLKALNEKAICARKMSLAVRAGDQLGRIFLSCFNARRSLSSCSDANTNKTNQMIKY